MTAIIKTRLERLLDERTTVSKLHDDLLAHVETRDGQQGLTEIETEQIAGYRSRSAALDVEIEELDGHLKREAQSARTSEDVRAHLAGRMEGVTVEGNEIKYGSIGAYARDVILARVKGDAAEQVVQMAGGEEVRRAARERLARTPAHTLSSDVEGLLPDQHIARIFQVIQRERPLVASATRAPLLRGRLSFPKVTQKPVVAAQVTEKTEAGNRKMIIGMEETTATVYLGGGNLSWQSIEWSSPNALDLWFDFAAEDYALKTEQDAGEVLQTAGFINNAAVVLDGTDTFGDWMTAIASGRAEVYANSGRIADTLYLAPSEFFDLTGLTTEAGAAFVSAGQLEVPGAAGTIAGLAVVMSRGLDAGVAIVGVRSQLLVAETPGAPVQLRAVEPAIGGLEVGVIGGFEAVVVEDEAFALISTAS